MMKVGEFRNKTCGELGLSDVNKKVILIGWVAKVRKFGSIIFVDLRDFYGITQLLFKKDTIKEFEERKIGDEYLVQIVGKVKRRLEENPDLLTGKIEVEVEKILSVTKSRRDTASYKANVSEKTAIEDRVLNLRRPDVKEKIVLKHKLMHAMRKYLVEEKFIEIETPLLTRSSPEGAHDFLVLSRERPEEFYSLAQSPQIFKQLLMIAGFDRYFQFAKCFRDEDLRSDRQPEFLQLDLEMSFVERQDVMNFVERIIFFALKEIGWKSDDIVFSIVSYNEVVAKNSGAEIDNKLMKKKQVKSVGAKLNFTWVVDLPLFSDKEGKLVSFHHPFVKARNDSLASLSNVTVGTAYDLYLNGIEIASGSLRVDRLDEQLRIFEKLGYTLDQAWSEFGYFLENLNYAVPPHGGIALGIDRILMVIAASNSIREFVAFPKNTDGKCVLTSAPVREKGIWCQKNEKSVKLRNT